MYAPFRIVAVYAVIASLWIVSSDMVVSFLFSDIRSVTMLAIGKGLVYVGVTSLLLFFMIRRALREKILNIKMLNQSVDEKNRLISELHHRIKNNLQMISVIVKMDLSDNSSCCEKGRESILSKIRSMSSVHELVYRNRDFSKISLAESVDALCRIQNVSERGWKVELDILSSLYYHIEVLNSLMLILNELLVICTQEGGSLVRISADRPGTLSVAFVPPISHRAFQRTKVIDALLTDISSEILEEEGRIILNFKPD